MGSRSPSHLELIMDTIMQEIRLSRAFACAFEEFYTKNPDKIPFDLLAEYIKLKKHYEYCMSRELS